MKNLYNLLSLAVISAACCYANDKNTEKFSLSIQQQQLPTSVSNAYHSVALTGFNHDVVANGTGQANLTTTATIDFSNEYYSADFVPSSPYNGASAATIGGGLPANGQIASEVTAGLSYQLADYGSSNVLLLRPLTSATGTLSFGEPYTANSVYVLWVATETQANNVGVTIHFNDGTTQLAVNQIAYDWVGGNMDIALNGLGRIGAGVTQWAQMNEFSEVGNCKLFEKRFDILPANQAKAITGISFNYAASGDYQSLAVFAVNVFGEALGVDANARKPVAVYPNPSSGNFFVQSEMPILDITAMNTIGQQVKTVMRPAISLEDFPKGIYFLKIQFENGIIETRKVVKN